MYKKRGINLKEIEQLLMLPNREVEKMSIEQKKEYYSRLREYCESLKLGKANITIVQKIISRLGSSLRNYDYDIRNIENIPDNGALFICNHSNSHDAFTVLETMSSDSRPGTIMVANEGITPIIKAIYNKANFTLVNRHDSISSNKGLYDFAGKLMDGNNCFLFGESTWNLHPILPMQNIKFGGTKIAAIAQKPIIPVIFEYLEIPDFCKEEKELYEKCIVKFGKPIYIDETKDLFKQTLMIQKIMEQMRMDIWKENNVVRYKLSDINPELYINHTGLKIFGGPAKFDYEREKSCLLSLDSNPVEFMYTLDDNGVFVPGELTEDVYNRVMKKH